MTSLLSFVLQVMVQDYFPEFVPVQSQGTAAPRPQGDQTVLAQAQTIFTYTGAPHF